jgi:ATP-dependent DNA helicase RecQ
MTDPKEILKNVFGHDNFRGKQEAAINSLLKGENVLALFPTGAGKSLCYQLPAILLPGTAVVISPLIALMKDQVDALIHKGIVAAILNSSINRKEQASVEKDLLNNKLKLLYVSPERLMTPYFLNLLKKSKISLFAIDEAHCISQWGHDFRPEYNQLKILVEEFPEVPRIALTATAGEATRKEILEGLSIDKAQTFISSFDRPNIRYTVAKKQTKSENLDKLINFIETEHPNDSGIVYCLSRKNTEETALELRRTGHKAYAYHAGLPQEERSEVQEKFLKEKKIIVVATIAFGMGIDKPDVRFVAHMSMPKCLESYYQETGRAGRDGLASHAWMLYSLADLLLLKRMMNKGLRSIKRQHVNEEKLDAILGFCETTKCRREVLLNYFNDPYRGPCQNCDICLSPLTKRINATQIAQTALHAVYETKQNFPIAHLVDVLLGQETSKVLKYKHHELKSFKAGLDEKDSRWFSLYRQLIAGGYLKASMDGSAEIKLTEKAIPVIEGKEEIWLRTDLSEKTKPILLKKVASPSKKKKSSRKSASLSLASSGDTLFDRLKIFRTQLAKQKRTKSYKIFPDRTLYELATKKPSALHELEDIFGVGPKKLKKYGKIFLEAITQLDQN